MSRKMLLGTQHHAQMVRPPLSGAEMTPQGWGTEGTYLSGGGFVRQSQDSHRQYIFEWSGARSVEEASYMQALRDGVYSKSRRDLIYFIDPNIYSKNILPKRWAQPGILAPDSGTTPTPLGTVSKIDGPGVLGLPLTGAQVSGYFTSLAVFDATTTPQAGSIWVPVPLGETLYLVAWTGDFATQESGLYVKAQNLDGTWRPAERVEGLGVKVTGARGVLLASVGLFNYFGARAVIGRGDGWADPAVYAWTGDPDDSTSTRTTVEGTVTNLFENPRFVTLTGDGGIAGLTTAYNVPTLQPSQGGGNELTLTGTNDLGPGSGWMLPLGAMGVIVLSGVSLVTVKARVRIPEGYDASEDEDVDDYDNEKVAARTLRIDSEFVQAPSEPGEYELSVSANVTSGGTVLFTLGGSGKPGQEITWLPGVTVVEGAYDGPRFTGSTPSEGPEWLPGLGHSGCAFVGNPTWIANSGVNGGQVGYAATLKEVGDWQQ